MTEIVSLETYYKADLRIFVRELTALYWNWTKDLAANKPISEHYSELRRLEYAIYKKACEDIIQRLSELVRSLERLITVDTRKLNDAIIKAQNQKAKAERYFAIERKFDEAIQLIKTTLDDIFTTCSECEANRKNLENRALTKWITIILMFFAPIMVVYVGILNYTRIELPIIYVISIPAIIFLSLLLFVYAIFSRE